MTALRLGNVSCGSVSATVEVMTEREFLDQGAPWMAITVSIGHRREKLPCAALPWAETVQALCRRLCSSAIPVADDFAMNSVA